MQEKVENSIWQSKARKVSRKENDKRPYTASLLATLKGPSQCKGQNILEINQSKS